MFEITTPRPLWVNRVVWGVDAERLCGLQVENELKSDGRLSPAPRLLDEGEDVGDALVGIRGGNMVGVATHDH